MIAKALRLANRPDPNLGLSFALACATWRRRQSAATRRAAHRDQRGGVRVRNRGVIWFGWAFVSVNAAKAVAVSTALGRSAGCSEAGQVLGTADFMAPEQAADPRLSDPRASLVRSKIELDRFWQRLVEKNADGNSAGELREAIMEVIKLLRSARASAPDDPAISAQFDAYLGIALAYDSMVSGKPKDASAKEGYHLAREALAIVDAPLFSVRVSTIACLRGEGWFTPVCPGGCLVGAFYLGENDGLRQLYCSGGSR